MNEQYLELTPQESLAAMYQFWRDIYLENQNDAIGAALSDISLLSDGNTADSAAYEDWIKCICIELAGMGDSIKWFDVKFGKKVHNDTNHILNEDRSNLNTSAEQAFSAMCNYWDEVAQRTGSKDLADILSAMNSIKSRYDPNSGIWKKWIKCTTRAKASEINNFLQFVT